jgi:hypothetical protein
VQLVTVAAPSAVRSVVGPQPADAPTDDPKVTAGTKLKQAVMGVPMVAAMTAMSASMSGTKTLTPQQLLAQLPIDKFDAALGQAIDGAVAAAPDLAAQKTALDQAHAGVIAWVKAQQADATTQISLTDKPAFNAWMDSYAAAGGAALLQVAQQLAPNAPLAPPTR